MKHAGRDMIRSYSPKGLYSNSSRRLPESRFRVQISGTTVCRGALQERAANCHFSLTENDPFGGLWPFRVRN